jgi:hypothetical protein
MMLRSLKNAKSKSLFAGTVGAIVALTLPAAAALALFFVYPPGSLPLLKPYGVHAANWWKWVLAQPASKSPLLDDTGANCGQGQSGLAWYLAGAPGNDAVYRQCTLPAGRTLIFPVVNAAYFAFTTDPPDQRTEAYVRSQNTFVEQATNLEVEIDGVSIPNVKSFLEKSQLFDVTLPADNIFGLDAGTVLSPSADEGYYLAIAPLLPGHHTLHFHGEVPGLVQDVTYDLTVKPTLL